MSEQQPLNHDVGRLRGRPVYVVDGTRTPFLKARGGPGPFHASDLALSAGRALLMRHGVAAEALDQVVLGCVSSGPDEANIARVVALRLGCGERVPAWTVQRNCASVKINSLPKPSNLCTKSQCLRAPRSRRRGRS